VQLQLSTDAEGSAVLDLGRTYVGPRGAVCIAEALRDAPAVRELDLSGNQLTNREAAAIAEGLMHAPHIRSVNLSGNPAISAAGGRALMRAVRAGFLDRVALHGTSVPPALLREFEELGSQRPGLSESIGDCVEDATGNPMTRSARATARSLFIAAVTAPGSTKGTLSGMTGFTLLVDAMYEGPLVSGAEPKAAHVAD
jgi:hypothetical protein